MSFVLALVATVIAYILGSLPMGVLAARIVKGVEIREIGSGRTGATNAYRAAGPWGLALTSRASLSNFIHHLVQLAGACFRRPVAKMRNHIGRDHELAIRKPRFLTTADVGFDVI